ncbi:MAG: MBL fold metallo-hydrolase [Anaerovoracaceae bacterium]|jgi:glyoxylase-like metal-dependent hydrolase (beta-lactamase superfamily II)|nr:MBL fold metallo-hydrolase [Anaerovoracaceae bacterium]
MVDLLLDNIYSIQISLPDNPLKSLNAYLILGEKNLLIDTGFNREECYGELIEALNSLNVDLNNTDLFITHSHSDHCGLTTLLLKKGCKAYCSEKDAKIINESIKNEYWVNLENLFARYGFPEKDVGRTTDLHPGKRFQNNEVVDFEILHDGDVISVGAYDFNCILTPGHTPGHMCLYDKKNKILISGDHILGDITPNICVETGMLNPLQLYLESLEKVGKLPVTKTLCAHRGQIIDVYLRISELQEHHEKRLKEVKKILCNGAKNAYETAQFMTWRISCNSWEDFPMEQKWFATGEAISHLNYLYMKGEIKRRQINGVYTFSSY